MKKSLGLFSLVSLLAIFSTNPATANEVSAARDLTSVIALLGLPCGKVVNVKPLGKDDNLASCENGKSYRVFLNPEGRVVAEKQ